MTATAEPNTSAHHLDGEIPAPDFTEQLDDLDLARGWAEWAARKLKYWINTESEGSVTPSTFIDLGLKLAGVHAKIADVEEHRKHLAAVAEWRERDLANQKLDQDLVRVLTPDRVAEVLAPSEPGDLFALEQQEAAIEQLPAPEQQP